MAQSMAAEWTARYRAARRLDMQGEDWGTFFDAHGYHASMDVELDLYRQYAHYRQGSGNVVTFPDGSQLTHWQDGSDEMYVTRRAFRRS